MVTLSRISPLPASCTSGLMEAFGARRTSARCDRELDQPEFHSWTDAVPTRLSVDPTNVNRMFGGAQDNGPQALHQALTWNGVAPCGDGGFSAIDPLVPNTVYVSGHGPCVEKSTTGGGLNTFLERCADHCFRRPNRVHPARRSQPSSPSNVYVGAKRVYQSTDGATTWTAISPDLTLGGTLAIVAVAPSDSNTIYTGSNDSLIAFTNNGLSGTSSSWFGGSLATRAVTDIKVDATPPRPLTQPTVGFPALPTASGTCLRQLMAATPGPTSAETCRTFRLQASPSIPM